MNRDSKPDPMLLRGKRRPDLQDKIIMKIIKYILKPFMLPIWIWINIALKQNKENAASVASLSFTRLNEIFPDELLSGTNVVITENIPIPFITFINRLGVSKFKKIQNKVAGVTYKNTIFINNHYKNDESLFFHELVHIVQWKKLGITSFLVTYSVGLLKFGYQNCPLEKMAFAMQAEFDSGNITATNIVEEIQQQTDEIEIG